MNAYAVPLEVVRSLNEQLFADFPIPSMVQKSPLGSCFSLENRNWIYLEGHHKPAPEGLVDLIERQLDTNAARMTDGAIMSKWALNMDWEHEDRMQKTAGLKQRLRREGWAEEE